MQYSAHFYPMLVAFIGQGAFVTMYATFPWWKSKLGRVLFFSEVALAAALAAALIRTGLVDSVIGYKISTVIFVIFGVSVWTQALALAQIRWGSSRKGGG